MERAKYWRDERLGGLELLRARFVRHAFMPHVHETYAIGVIEAGAERFRYRGAQWTAPSGSVVVIPPQEAHTGSAADAGGWTYRMLYPGADWLPNVGRFDTAVVSDDLLAQLLRRAHAALEGEASSLEKETRLRAALVRLARHATNAASHERAASGRSAVFRVRAALEERPEEDFTLSALAALADLSPHHLARAFKRQFGLPPHAYQTSVRVRKAAALLRSGLSLADVALTTGFSDQSHLTRTFKRVWGVTPGVYRRGT